MRILIIFFLSLQIWFVVVIVFLSAAQADTADEKPQMFDESKLQEKQHKRENSITSLPPPSLPTQATLPSQHQQPPHQPYGPRYVMKEMILYLTPSQIKDLQTGQGALKLEPQSQSHSRTQPQLPQFMQKLMQQNTLQQEGQLLQREIENLEANRKNRLQLKEAVANAPTENINHHQHHQQQKLQDQQQQQLLLQHQQQEPQQREQPPPPPQQQQHQQQLVQQEQQPLVLQMQPQHHQQQHKQQQQVQLQHLPNIVPQYRPELQLLNQEQHLGLLPQLQLISHQPHQESYLSQEKHRHQPVFYILPQIKPVGNENLHLFFNPAGPNHAQQQSLVLHKNQPLRFNDHNFNLIPYEYGSDNELEAKKILIAHLENQLEAYRLNAHQLDAKQLEASDQQFEAQRLEAVTQLTAQQYHQSTSNQLVDHQINVAAQNQAHQLNVQELNTAHDVKNLHLDAHNVQEVQNLQQDPHLNEAEQLQETTNLQQVHHFEEAEQLPEALPLIASFKSNYHEINAAPQLDNHHLKLDELQTLQDFQMKEIMDAQNLKKQILAQEKEAERLDAQLKAEELKVEGLKEEQQQLQLFKELNSEKNEFHSILNPLVQRHNIMDILNEPANFTPPELEKGFLPIEYAPKDNKEKYAREIEKILLENQIDKQNALTHAAAIANQPPVVVKEEIIKHVKIPIPAPYIVRIPEPFEVKVPQPYPVPLEIIRHIPYPVVKVEQLEVEKPVPFEVEKRVPYTVEKKIFVKVNKPYIVKRIVPVGVKKTVPIEIPIRNKSKKISIIKHVWGN